MKVYHSSDTAQVGTRLINDYKKNIELVRPFVIALKQNKECFFIWSIHTGCIRKVQHEEYGYLFCKMGK